jgi:hypothetical protein
MEFIPLPGASSVRRSGQFWLLVSQPRLWQDTRDGSPQRHGPSKPPRSESRQSQHVIHLFMQRLVRPCLKAWFKSQRFFDFARRLSMIQIMAI